MDNTLTASTTGNIIMESTIAGSMNDKKKEQYNSRVNE